MLRGRFLFPEFHPLHGAARTATVSFFEYIRETSRSMACAPWSWARSRISAVTFGGTAVSAGPDFHADDEAAPVLGLAGVPLSGHVSKFKWCEVVRLYVPCIQPKLTPQ